MIVWGSVALVLDEVGGIDWFVDLTVVRVGFDSVSL
jgi:hypothetical protein